MRTTRGITYTACVSNTVSSPATSSPESSSSARRRHGTRGSVRNGIIEGFRFSAFWVLRFAPPLCLRARNASALDASPLVGAHGLRETWSLKGTAHARDTVTNWTAAITSEDHNRARDRTTPGTEVMPPAPCTYLPQSSHSSRTPRPSATLSNSSHAASGHSSITSSDNVNFCNPFCRPK